MNSSKWAVISLSNKSAAGLQKISINDKIEELKAQGYDIIDCRYKKQ